MPSPVVGSSSRTPPPIRRRVFHIIAGSSIPCLAILLSPGTMVVLMSVLAGSALVVEAARLKLPSLNKVLLVRFKALLKEGEGWNITGATYFALSALAAFVLFDESIAIAVLLFLSLGDPAAALVGSRAGGIRFYGKSPWGTLAFILVALGVAGLLSGTGVAPKHWALIAGAVAAGLMELVPVPVDDNLTIPLVSGGIMTGMIAL